MPLKMSGQNWGYSADNGKYANNLIVLHPDRDETKAKGIVN